MAVNVNEVLNQLAAGNPALYRALQFLLPQIRRITISPVAVAQGTSAEQTFPCNGLNVGDFVFVIKPTVQAGLSIGGARVTAANTIGILFVNTPNAGGNITPTAAETYLVVQIQGLASSIVNQVA